MLTSPHIDIEMATVFGKINLCFLMPKGKLDDPDILSVYHKCSLKRFSSGSTPPKVVQAGHGCV